MNLRTVLKNKFFVLGVVAILLTIALLASFLKPVKRKESVTEKITVPTVRITGAGFNLTKDYSQAMIEYNNPNTSVNIKKEGKIKVRGNSTALAPKKPYKIKFEEKQDLLGKGEFKDWVLLANAFDKTLLRNKLVLDFGQKTKVSYNPNSEFVEVWLEDVFLGSYLLVDPIEAKKGRIEIDIENNEFLIEIEPDWRMEEGVTYITTKNQLLFGVNEPEEVTEEQREFLQDFLDKAEAAMLSGDKEEYTKYIDLDSFVDFYIIQELFKNVDVAFSSTRFYVKGDKLYAGPLWDFDLSSGNANGVYYPDYGSNQTANAEGHKGIWATKLLWYDHLMKDDYFLEQVKTRYKELQKDIVNLYEDNKKGTNQIDTFMAQYEASFRANYTDAKWDIDKPYSEYERFPNSTYKNNVEFLRQWFKSRNEWLLTHWEINK